MPEPPDSGTAAQPAPASATSDSSPSTRSTDELLPALALDIVRTLRQPVLILDADLKVRAANPAFYSVFEIEDEDLLGGDFVRAGDRRWDVPGLRELLEEILPGGRTVEDFEVEHAFSGVGRRTLLINARRLEGPGHAAELILLAIEDITERKRAEAELVRSNRELERFAYVASHDLQEPLRMVSSYTELLARRYEGELDERADKYIRYAVEGAQRMKALIEALLRYSRVGNRSGDPQPTDPGAVLREVLTDLELAIQESGAQVTHEELPRVSVDPLQLRQLLQNLLENALKFSGDDSPTVHVAGDREGVMVRISVTDEGPGIEEEYLDDVFVPFQRLVGSEVEGTGIGLALCKRIVELHGGELRVESEPGVGSTFHFTLPAVEEAS